MTTQAITEELILSSVKQQLLAICPTFRFENESEGDWDTLTFYQETLLQIHRVQPLEGFRIGIDISLIPGMTESNLTIIQFTDCLEGDSRSTINNILDEAEIDSYQEHNSYGQSQLFINFPF